MTTRIEKETKMMPVRAVYVPHVSGTVLGEYHQPPWLADSAARAAATPWRGQPVFTDRMQVFAWLHHARAGTPQLPHLSVAHIHTDIDPQVLPQLRFDRSALCDPHRQVVRAHPHTTGPDPSVLHALYAAIHEHAAGLRASNRDAARNPAADLLRAVWARAYPIAFHDARTVVAHRIGHAAALLASDPQPPLNIDEQAQARLTALTTVEDPPVDRHVPAPPEPLLASVADLVGDGRHGWRHAVDQTWTCALVTGATGGLSKAAAELTTTWTAAAPTPAESPVGGWLRATLVATHQAVLVQWRDAAGHHTRTERPALTPLPSRSTVDAAADRLPAPAVLAALPAGRSR